SSVDAEHFVNPNDENEEEAKGRPLVFTDHQINVDGTKDGTSSIYLSSNEICLYA
ncbi:hypothetical protein U1Q18_048342, partial [Sarracenia purpurea var. burkii]